MVCLSECFKAKCIIIFTQREVWIAAGRRLADNTSLGRSKAAPGVFVARRPSFETFTLAEWEGDTRSAERRWLKSQSKTSVLTASGRNVCSELQNHPSRAGNHHANAGMGRVGAVSLGDQSGFRCNSASAATQFLGIALLFMQEML